MLKRLEAPVEHIQFDEHKGDEPQECVPEIDEITFPAPVGGCEKQERVQDVLARRTDFQRVALEEIAFLQANIDFQHQYNDKPDSRIDDVDPCQSNNIRSADLVHT